MKPTHSTKPQKTCFVVMGFGKKTDYETNRVLDLDKSYNNMIKPAVEAAGLKCIRADEIVHSGLIDVPMYEQLLNADVVVADLSTSNKNAYYELGIRHALRPFTTIIVAEDGSKGFPFDVNHVAVRQYHHLGEDIGYDEVMRFQAMLTQAIKDIVAQDPMNRDSPVYTFLQDLMPPALKQLEATALSAAAAVSASEHKAAAPAAEAPGGASLANATHSALMAQVDEAQLQSDWLQMKSLLEVVRKIQAQGRQNAPISGAQGAGQEAGEDPYILQRLAFATYKAKQPTEEAALLAARNVLAALAPGTTNDTETLGLWGSIHKSLWELTKHKADASAETKLDSTKYLNEGIRAYERGYYLRNNYYNGINFAFLLNARAASSDVPAEAIADFVQAQRVRQEVVQLCDQWLAAHPVSRVAGAEQPEADQKKNATSHYWVLATKAEAYLGLGLEEQADQTLAEAYSIAPETWMQTRTDEQRAKLRELLANSPLRFIGSSPASLPAV